MGKITQNERKLDFSKKPVPGEREKKKQEEYDRALEMLEKLHHISIHDTEYTAEAWGTEYSSTGYYVNQLRWIPPEVIERVQKDNPHLRGMYSPRMNIT